MKRLPVIVLLLFLCNSSFAQNKIAVVNTDAFYDERLRITDLVIAYKELEVEFKPIEKEYQSLYEKLQKIVIEVQNGHSYRGTKMTPFKIQKKSEEQLLEAQNLSNKIKMIIDNVNPRLEKRKSELIEPVNKRIGEKLKAFAKQKGFTSVFEFAKSENSEKSGCVCYHGVCILYIDYPDVTNEFIKFCNEEFEKEKLQKSRVINQPERRHPDGNERRGREHFEFDNKLTLTETQVRR
jgi:Skp family chaperone for outer membrane proteins